jgi:hypothetical protein
LTIHQPVCAKIGTREGRHENAERLDTLERRLLVERLSWFGGTGHGGHALLRM